MRLRGEISKVTRHASGHIYLSLKDDKAVIDGVVWKGSVRGLGIQPQTGLEVIVTGRITTYPARSSYQLIIETMAPAGVGALLAQLEKLKAKLQAEGLFDPARKRPLPAMPGVIGVITSPTGAVIRDILHRIADRWPAHVIVCAGGGAGRGRGGPGGSRDPALQRDRQHPRHPPPGPADRGGAAADRWKTWWPFNDEALARAVAAGTIPLISAVGHETDTTLIDFVSDRRAPTPTAAAEIATPVLAELKAVVLGFEQRMARCTNHALEVRRTRPFRRRARPAQAAGHAGPRRPALRPRGRAVWARRWSGTRRAHERDLIRIAARLSPGLLDRPRRAKAERVAELGARLKAASDRRLAQLAERLDRTDQLRRSFNPDGPLTRGFARVHQADGALVRSAAALKGGEPVKLVFADGERGAVMEGTAAKAKPRPAASPSVTQGDLF